jgi:transcriptional regulator with XRE-family HTH domain
MGNSLRKRFGFRFRELRIAHGMSQEAFADHASVARSYLSRVERGIANPSLDAIEGLAHALGVDVHELFSVTPVVSPPEIIELPYAADGTFFHRGLASSRNGSFRVGSKGNEVRLASFEQALAYLKNMPVAKWRRPNKNGNWGMVSAVGWSVWPGA